MSKRVRSINIFLIITLVLSSMLLSGCGGKSSADVLNIYNVGDYIDEELLDKFTKETGIKIIYETYDTNEIMYQKLKNGGNKYDLVFPSDYMIEKMKNEDMLSPIDFNNIPNIRNIDEKFLNPSYDINNEYSVPYFWGTFGILYNTTMVKEKVDSWDILWDKKYKKNILMFDSVRDTMGISLMRLGYSLNTTNYEELEEAKEELLKQKPLVYAYVNDEGKDRLINDEVAMGIIYSGDAVTLMDENENLRYAIPKEGTNKWVDAMCIPKDAENKKEAEMFINFILDPKNAKQNIDYVGYSTPNKAAYDILDDETKENEVAYPKDSIIKNTEVFKDLGDYIKVYDDLWLEIKSK